MPQHDTRELERLQFEMAAADGVVACVAGHHHLGTGLTGRRSFDLDHGHENRLLAGLSEPAERRQPAAHSAASRAESQSPSLTRSVSIAFSTRSGVAGASRRGLI